MHAIIDVACDVGPYAQALAQAGVKTVIRYYNHRNSQKLPTKCLTQRELDQLFDAGLSVATVFQQRGGAGEPNGNISDFSAEMGRRDAARALELARNYGQPTGSAIYFGVDHDFYRAADLAPIKAYFQAAKAALDAASYRTGVYGSGAVGKMLKAAGAVELVWLAAARKWSGTQDALASGAWTIDQRFLELRSEIGGFIYDGNVFNPAYADFGQFGRGAALESPRGEGTAALFEVIARSGLNLRRTPDTSQKEIRALATGTVVRGLGETNGWLKADVDGDGLVDGFLSAEFMRAVSGGVPLSRPDPAAPVRPVDIARAEMARDVREIAGAQNNPRVVMYHATTTGGAAPDETAWCSSFVNYCVEQAGLRGTDSKWARSWHETHWGMDVTAQPQDGDVVVWRRVGAGDDGGHVGFYVSSDANSIQVLGGNQGNRIQVQRYPKNGVLGPYTYTLLSIRRG